MRLKFIPAAFVAFLLTIVLIQACKKTDSPAIPVSKQFTTKAAKEWWYGSFRKSVEYSQIDENSPLAQPVGGSAKKYPSWKRAISYSVGRLQIVELPLTYETNSILLPDMQKLHNTPELARIAKSAIHKLMLIKKADGTMAVRTVTIVPSPEYAKQYNYDITHINLKSLPSDFSGYQMISGWDKSEKNILRISAGRPVKKVKIITAKVLASQKLAANAMAREVCDMVWVPRYVWVCVVVPTGDDLADQERCREIGHEVEQGGDYQLQCREVPDEDPCVEMSSENCMCQLYGIGCGGGGDGGGGGGSGFVFDPNNLPIIAADKPLQEFPNKCTGLSNSWNNYPQNEVHGYITQDGKVLVSNILNPNGGTASGLYKHSDGTNYYTYPDSQGAPAQTYAGMLHQAGRYFIPISASFHTHSPCRTDGTNGVSHDVSDEDKQLANDYPNIKHWAIGCGAVAQFNGDDDFFNVNYGQISSTCSAVQ